MKTTLLLVTLAAVTIPAGYWPEERTNEILAKVETIRLAPDLSKLTDNEQAALRDLLEVGRIFQDIYEDSRHHQALQSREALKLLDDRAGHPKQTQNLLQLYRLWHGPIVTTLDNKREPLLPVDPQVAGRNVYPIDSTKAEIEAFLAKHPEQRASILHERTVVRRATKENLDRDLAVLSQYAAIEVLHPKLQHDLKKLARTPDRNVFYAVPYPVAWAEPMMKAYRRLRSAADLLESSDAEFAGYLRNRARDLLANDYESGDAAWVTGRFQRFNAQIGSYETYDDAMFGVKAFHAVSLLLANEPATSELRKAVGSLQVIEDALPYEPRKRVRDDIPVGVYHVIADFGQARGANTATILPNDPLFARRYGRTILLRENIMKNPAIFASDERVWRAAAAPAHVSDLTADGPFQRTLWHEIGHYLGPDGSALEDYEDATEEMKADLVSLFSFHHRHAKGEVSDAMLRSVQAAGIRRTLQNVQPRRDQPYQTMQLIQFNWFLENGLIAPDAEGRLIIRYDRYREVTDSLLREVLALQKNGDKAAAAKFFDRWTKWTPEVHERLAQRIRDAQGARWRIVRYAALGE